MSLSFSCLCIPYPLPCLDYMAHPISPSTTDTLNSALLSFLCICQATAQLCLDPANCWSPTALKLHRKGTPGQTPWLAPPLCSTAALPTSSACFPPASPLSPSQLSELTLPPTTPSSWRPRCKLPHPPTKTSQPTGLGPILFTSCCH